MLSRCWLALLLEMEEADVRISSLPEGRLDAIVGRSLATSLEGLVSDEGLARLRQALDECGHPGLSTGSPDMASLCRLLYQHIDIAAARPAMSFDEFEIAFGRFIVQLRNALAIAAGPQLIDPLHREFGVLNIGQLSQLQAPEELCRHMASLVASFQERQAISASDADHVIGLVEKMVSAPGYLRFLGDDRKRRETARLLKLVIALQSPDVPPGPATSDLIAALGLLLYNISPSEMAAAGLAAVRPSAACPALQYHYHAIMALNYLLTGKFALAEGHAAAASDSAADAGRQAYLSILQGCIALGQGDHGKAADRLEKAAAGAPAGRIRALACFYRGVLFAEKEEYVDAIGCFREAGSHVADPLDSATIHNNIGSCASHLGDLAVAEHSFTEMEKLADRLNGDAALQCRLAASSHLGAIGLAKGDYPGAMERCRQALKLALRSVDGEIIANQLGNLGAACAGAGDAGAAMQLLDACMACSERLSYWPGIRFAYWNIRLLAEENEDDEARKLMDGYVSRHPELKDLR